MELLRYLRETDPHLPAIMITGHSAVPMAVEAMKAGAFDFIEKPVGINELLASVGRAVDLSRDASARHAWKGDAARSVAGLTARQHQIMDMVLAGHPSKNIAADLGISQRTVENHRAAIMRLTNAKSLPALTRLAVAATAADSEELLGEQRLAPDIAPRAVAQLPGAIGDVDGSLSRCRHATDANRAKLLRGRVDPVQVAGLCHAFLWNGPAVAGTPRDESSL
jgi:two-component system CheB/CheR fusion protein